MSSPPVRIGLIGAGFLAETRVRCYRRLAGVAEVVSVCARRPERAAAFAERFQLPSSCEDASALLGRDDVDLVELCVPNDQHRPLAVLAAAAGKHIVCTKPLTAYVGQDLGPDVADSAVSEVEPERMLEVALADAQAMVAAAASAGVMLGYAENWIYAPAIRRCAELAARVDGVLLEMRGWESHSGSHSPYSKLWRHTGGGALLRLGAHPVGAMIWLKRVEGLRRGGQPIRPVSVTAETADLTRAQGVRADNLALGSGWVDVENWGVLTLAFEDGTRGVAYGSDNMLGGMESRMELSASNASYRCNLSPVDLLRAYAPEPGVFGDEYIMEKSSTDAGWSTPMPDEDWTSGQLAMVQAFAEAARSGVPPESDGELGLEVTRVLYSAYVSARSGRRVAL